MTESTEKKEALDRIRSGEPIKSARNRKEIQRLLVNPYAIQDKFGYTDDENYTYRIVLVSGPRGPSRHKRFLNLGYETVSDQRQTGNRLSGEPASTAQSVSTRQLAEEEFVVMRIPTPLYKENQEIKRDFYKAQLKLDGNSQKQKVTGTSRNLKIESETLTANSPLHPNMSVTD